MDKLLNEQQAAELLTLKPETLTKWRSSHKGPPYLKIAGGRVRYDRALLEQWVRDQNALLEMFTVLVDGIVSTPFSGEALKPAL
jgi:hypothetical protein